MQPTSAPTPKRPQNDASTAAHALFGVAMLKIALELKKSATTPFDSIVAGVAQRMNLDLNAFESFLHSNAGLLNLAAQHRQR